MIKKILGYGILAVFLSSTGFSNGIQQVNVRIFIDGIEHLVTLSKNSPMLDEKGNLTEEGMLEIEKTLNGENVKDQSKSSALNKDRLGSTCYYRPYVVDNNGLNWCRTNTGGTFYPGIQAFLGYKAELNKCQQANGFGTHDDCFGQCEEKTWCLHGTNGFM